MRYHAVDAIELGLWLVKHVRGQVIVGLYSRMLDYGLVSMGRMRLGC